MMRDRFRPRAVWRIGLVLCLAAVAIIANSGCRGRRLAGALDSPEAVARAVLQGLAGRNVDGLRALAITEEEFRDLVWPKLPTSRPERHVPWDYAWQDLHGKSRMQMQARLNEWRDQGFELVRVEFEGEKTDYGTFRIFRKSAITVRDRSGHETRGRLFGSVIEQDGRYKVFSYIVD